MKVVKEEVAAQEDTQAKEGGMNKQQFMAYKKALKEEVEMLELETRRIKAQVEYYIFSAKLAELHKTIESIENAERVKDEEAKPKMGLWTPQGEV